MNVLKKCCFCSLKENRKRTTVTIIGIILSTALIMAVACMSVSFRASLIAYEKQQNGNWHYHFLEVEPGDLKYFENNRNIEKIGIISGLGYAVLEGSRNPDKPFLYLSAADDAGMEMLSLQLIEGRMPENDTELVISNHIRANGQVDIKVGDTLALQVGERSSEGYCLKQYNPYTYEEETFEPVEEKTYTVTGIVERPNYVVEQRMAPGYSVFTCLEDVQEAKSLDVYVNYTDWGLRHAEQVTSGLSQLAESAEENYWLIKWMKLNFSSNTMNMLYGMSAIAILIIIVTSVSCIRNSFMISLTEKMKLYGRLASVGTTSKQQKKIVYYEAAFLGSVGIPVGILCGILATMILVQVVGGMLKEAMGIKLIFAVSLPAVLLAVLLAAVTIFFSAFQSARRAARVSPISAIRANDTVKVSARELRCPKLIARLFGMGGKLAYKNLKRARVKYRTTVRAIAVSVAVFIGVSTFVQLMSYAARFYYEDRQYQLRVTIYGEDSYAEALRISRLEGIEASEVVRYGGIVVDREQIPYTGEFLEQFSVEPEEVIRVYALGEEGYARYCKEVGVTVEEAEDKAIVFAHYNASYTEKGKIQDIQGNVAEFRRGDIISGEAADNELQIEVLTQTEKKPMFMANVFFNQVVLIVSDAWLDSHEPDMVSDSCDIVMRCSDADRLEAQIRDMQPVSYTLTNYDALYRSDRSMYLMIAIFLYGFIAVVSLIGITNIFNTITTNMELRAPEFAMLKAVGMTNREFKRMIWLEGLFYGGKALMIGIPLGILISFGFHKALSKGIVTAFKFPIQGTLLATVGVFLLLYCIMRYSLRKFNRKNIVETIRNENI